MKGIMGGESFSVIFATFSETAKLERERERQRKEVDRYRERERVYAGFNGWANLGE